MPCVAALFVLFMFVCVFVYDGRCLFVFVFASASNVCINVREPPCSHMFVYVHVRAVVWRTADTGFLICEAGGSASAFNSTFSDYVSLAIEPSLAGEGLFLLESKSLKAI